MGSNGMDVRFGCCDVRDLCFSSDLSVALSGVHHNHWCLHLAVGRALRLTQILEKWLRGDDV